MDLNKVDVKSQDRDILVSLIGQFLPHSTVWAFGSRIKGNARPWSDLDLVAFTKTEQRPQVSFLKEALEESNLPFRVDLLEWDRIPESFRENIKAEYVVVSEDSLKKSKAL